METSKNKIWMGWLAFLFIVVHFSFIVGYALPDQFSSPSLKSFATPYVEPLFTQTWGMFAPCPTTNANVEVKFYFENDSTDWLSPTADAREKHKLFRGTHHGELVLAESNLIYWLETDMNLMDIQIGQPFPTDRINEFQKGYSYFKIKDYLSGNARYLYDREIVAGRIRIEMENVVTKATGRMELPQFNY